ncbi:MAG: hypothetical protein CVT81_03735 [Alphaproteobacteria bacterium HGW-Alphaproteobacteria-3]|nr:MAG: hypothetical protein CVT81_03735 [Alphaproteobacteria bacterium HGW-Alphaproteobacteria-3]
MPDEGLVFSSGTSKGPAEAIPGACAKRISISRASGGGLDSRVTKEAASSGGRTGSESAKVQ